MNEENSELTKEIERGERAIQDLAQHLYAMSAQSVTRSIAIENTIVEIVAIVRARIDESNN
jgi:hypothetical protein